MRHLVDTGVCYHMKGHVQNKISPNNHIDCYTIWNIENHIIHAAYTSNMYANDTLHMMHYVCYVTYETISILIYLQKFFEVESL